MAQAVKGRQKVAVIHMKILPSHKQEVTTGWKQKDDAIQYIDFFKDIDTNMGIIYR